MDTTGSGEAQCLLVTGGFGFVMSHVVKAWLGGGHGKCIVLDLPGRLDEAVRVFLGPAAVAANANAAAEGGDGGDAAGNAAEGVGGGGSSSDGLLHYVAGSVTDAGAWARVGALGVRVTHIVHAAAVTPTAAEEVSFPARVLEVNLLGSVAALDFARSLPGGQLRRFIYTSSDGVFNAPGLARGYPPAAAAAAAAAPAASSLYPISKYAMEKVVERYAELFPAALGGGALLTVRFSDGVAPPPAHSVLPDHDSFALAHFPRFSSARRRRHFAAPPTRPYLQRLHRQMLLHGRRTRSVEECRRRRKRTEEDDRDDRRIQRFVGYLEAGRAAAVLFHARRGGSGTHGRRQGRLRGRRQRRRAAKAIVMLLVAALFKQS